MVNSVAPSPSSPHYTAQEKILYMLLLYMLFVQLIFSFVSVSIYRHLLSEWLILLLKRIKKEIGKLGAQHAKLFLTVSISISIYLTFHKSQYNACVI